jgi:hypothetical protein
MNATNATTPRSDPWVHDRGRPGLRPSSLTVWAAVVGYLAAAELLLATLPESFRSAGQAGLFEWSSIAVFAALGAVGVSLADRVGFMPAWDARVSNRERLLLPTLIGAAIGAVAVVLDLLTRATLAIAAVFGQPSFNIDFPASLLAYSGGGVLVDVQYRLFAVPFLLWLVSRVLLRGRGETRTFWVLAAVSSLVEPVLQGVGITLMSGGAITPLMLAAYLPTAIANNAAAVVVFRRYGFVASLLVRQGEYLVWHILYGNVLHPWLLG